MTNFNQMDMEYKLDYLSDLLADQILKSGDTYTSLTSAQQESVKVGFHSDLANENIEVTTELIEAVKVEFSSSPMADMLIEYIETNAVEVTAAQQEVMDVLKVGRKVSIVKLSEFGFPQLIHTVIESIKVDRYAQYNNALYITHKPKRKRNTWTDVILPYQHVTVYDGWIDFDIDSASKVTLRSNERVTVKQSKYGSFDPRFIQDIQSILSVTPLISINSRKEAITC
ncbi:hypothetical protein [Paenibacillus illinoisensis]|uniref:Uncharacterized protein n=1 Tax=Paenibacillus illinoisensis TaxID=59845 RepID=A0A2W0CXF8_9BACL|nr:hypothetical protein [Paenibacillus illinoisensis]PYY28331.1 Uncharacterized protein PIL02S_03482 [Paenibacillus illinoisensis]